MAYNPADHTVSAKALGVSGNVPTDGRSMLYDGTNFVSRAFVSTAEAVAYLTTAAQRNPAVPIVINSGGTLNNGVITGGTNELWHFKDGKTDGSLVRMMPFNSTTAFADQLNTALAGNAGNIAVTRVGNTYRFDLAWDGVWTNPDAIPDVDAATLTKKRALTLFPVLTPSVALTGNTWNLGTQPYVEQTISASTDYTLTGGTNGLSSGVFIITNSGTNAITINGDSYAIRDNGSTAIGVRKLLNGTYYISTDYSAATPAPPLTDDANYDVVQNISHSGTDWTNTYSSSGSALNTRGLDTTHVIPVGTDVEYFSTLLSAANDAVVLGLDDSATADFPQDSSGNAVWLYSCIMAQNTVLYAERGGAFTAVTVTLPYGAGSSAKLQITGASSTPVVELVITDDAGATWSTVYTFTGTYPTTALHPKLGFTIAGKVCHTPKIVY